MKDIYGKDIQLNGAIGGETRSNSAGLQIGGTNIVATIINLEIYSVNFVYPVDNSGTTQEYFLSNDVINISVTLKDNISPYLSLSSPAVPPSSISLVVTGSDTPVYADFSEITNTTDTGQTILKYSFSDENNESRTFSIQSQIITIFKLKNEYGGDYLNVEITDEIQVTTVATE